MDHSHSELVEELRRLKQERDDLEEELHTVKNNAIEVLVYKDREIEQLTSKIAATTAVSQALAPPESIVTVEHPEEAALVIRTLQEKIDHMEEEKSTLDHKMTEVLAMLDTDRMKNEELIHTLKSDLEDKLHEIECIRDELRHVREEKSSLIDEMHHMDDKAKEWETKFRNKCSDIVDLKRKHESEVERFQGLLNDARQVIELGAHVRNTDDEADLAESQKKELRRERHIRDLENLLKLRADVIQTLETENGDLQKRISGVLIENSRLSNTIKTLEHEYSTEKQVKADLADRLDSERRDFDNQYKEVIAVKTRMELELSALKKEAQSDSRFMSDVAPFDADRRVVTEPDSDLLSKEIDDDEIMSRSPPKWLTRGAANHTFSSMLTMENLTIDCTSTAAAPVEAKRETGCCEQVKEENARLHAAFMRNQKHLVDEMNFLKEQLKLAENQAFEAQIRYKYSQMKKGGCDEEKENNGSLSYRDKIRSWFMG